MRYVVIGNSAAGVSGVKAIRANDTDSEITMIGKDDFFYSRCQLHLLASGKRDKGKIKFISDIWPDKVKLDFRKGTEVTSLDTKNSVVKTDKGDKISYDKLLITTGSSATLPPIKGIEGKGVFHLRNIEDAEKINKALPPKGDISIIGAGLIGVFSFTKNALLLLFSQNSFLCDTQFFNSALCSVY